MIFGLIDVGMKIDVPGGTGILTIYLPNPVDGNYQWFKHSPTLGWIVFDRDVVSGGGGDGAEFNAARDQITIYITDNGPYDDDPTPGVIRDPSGVGTAVAGADSTGGEDGGGGGCFISTASGGSSPVHVQGASDGNRAFGWIIVSMLTGVVVDFCGRWRRR
jgi:protocadherin Fat 4